MTEPGCGSDVSGIKTKAVQKGDEVRVGVILSCDCSNGLWVCPFIVTVLKTELLVRGFIM